jgi:hypothetical protein
MEMTAALAQLSSGKGEEMAEAGVRNWGARGGPFIGARGGEGGERWRAPVSSPRRGWWRTMVTTGWLEQTGRRGGSGRRGDEMAQADARRQTELVSAIMVRRRGGQWPAAIASLARSRTRGRR